MMLSEKIRNMVEQHEAILQTQYGNDSILHFRATNLLTTIWAANLAMIILLFVFIFAPEGILDHRAKTIFTALLFLVAGGFTCCFHLVLVGKLFIARRILLSVTYISTASATVLTGGFPISVSTPALMIPVILAYCIYGGRVASITAISAPVFLTLQWATSYWFGFSFPDLASTASPEVNRVLVIATTFAITIFAMVSFDRSVRRYIETSEAALHSKASFLANMSHEIRTPMNGVIGLSEVMLKTELDESQKTYMDAIHTSGKSLLAIINDILDFSKIEAGHIVLTSAPLNFRDLLKDVVTLLAVGAREKNVNIHIDYPSQYHSDIVGDTGRLRQILVNLIGNAVKFTEEGQVLVKVSFRDNNNTDRVRVEIQDTGVGIPEGQVGMVFERFTQVDSSTTQKFGGTGLGLTISRKLVELMNGEIGVFSKLNVGSTFWFEIDAHIKPNQQLKEDLLSYQKNVLILTHTPNSCARVATALIEDGYKPHISEPSVGVIPFMTSADFLNNWNKAVIIDDTSDELAAKSISNNIRSMTTLCDVNVILVSSILNNSLANKANVLKPLNKKSSLLFDLMSPLKHNTQTEIA